MKDMDNKSAEPRRITPTRESLVVMKKLRDEFPALKKELPEIRGLGFFGSRVVGKERVHARNPSDLDVVFFYDGSSFETDESPERLLGPDGKVIPEALKEVSEERSRKRKDRVDFLLEAQQVVAKKIRAQGIPADVDWVSGNKAVLAVDISPRATDYALETLVKYVDTNADVKTGEVIIPDHVNSVIFPLVSRFFLGVGEALYQNRRDILNRLEEMERDGKDGERYFRGMMDGLRGIARPENQQGQLPKTIAEGKRYFRA